MKRREPWAHSQRTLYRIYFSGGTPECQGQFCKIEQFPILFFQHPPQKPPAFALTTGSERGRITPHAGMVELLDALDLGAVTSVKVFTRSN